MLNPHFLVFILITFTCVTNKRPDFLDRDSVSEKVVSEISVSEKVISEISVSEKVGSEISVSEKVGSEISVSEKVGSEINVSEKIVFQRRLVPLKSATCECMAMV